MGALWLAAFLVLVVAVSAVMAWNLGTPPDGPYV